MQSKNEGRSQGSDMTGDFVVLQEISTIAEAPLGNTKSRNERTKLMDQVSRDALFGVMIEWDDGESPFNEEFEAKLARLARQQQAISATMAAQEEPTALLREMHCREIKLRMELVQFCSLHSDELVVFYRKQISDYRNLMSSARFSLAPHSRSTASAPGDRAQPRD